MISFMNTLLAFSSLALVTCDIIPIDFSELEISKTQKVVVFHDPSVQQSIDAVLVLEALDKAGTYGVDCEYTLCTLTTPANVEAVKAAGFKEYPQIFTHTPESGVEHFAGDFTEETFAPFHEFRIMHITSDKVLRLNDASGVGDVNGPCALLALAAERPVLLKAYEEWCGHCTKLKKHFMFLSNRHAGEINNALLVEAECSKLLEPSLCKDLGVTGFPSMMLLYQGKYIKYTSGRSHADITKFLSDKSAWVFEDLPPKIAEFLPDSDEDDDEEGDDDEDASDDSDAAAAAPTHTDKTA
ncbi:hypothetical protein T484DRAFT_1754563 [Baffinella frigidus]|nr:hypothetical protein T484DRAFT_1754563 [Cryptophyta sp. CCMP2293]